MTTGEVIPPLTTSERTELDEREARIHAALKGFFFQVGAELAAIRKKRLYREQHEKFEQYCRRRWGFSASRGRQLISASAVYDQVVEQTGVQLPSEALTREVKHAASVTGVTLSEVVQTATANGQALTTKRVQEVTRELEQNQVKRQVNASGFSAIIQRMDKGELTPDAALALVDAIKSCEPKVRGDMLMLGTSDPAFIRLMNRKRHTETYAEIVRTGWLQAAKWQKQADKATVADLQRLLDERYQEHKSEAGALADAAKGIVEKTLTLKIGDLDYSASMLEQVYGYKNAVELAEYITQRAKQRELETGTAYVQ